jgi:glyoxylase-like metal-dependent hydrolase (beta-lactamase superfamily II)
MNLKFILPTLWTLLFACAAPAQEGSSLFPAEPRELAPGVWFQQVNGTSNCGWVVFDEYVLVIDANFSRVAPSLEERIKKTTSKPIKYVFDTHCHGDHAEANSWWISRGAQVVCQEECRAELERTGAEKWQEMLVKNPEFKAVAFKLPSVIFPKNKVFEDAHHRVELVTFGWAHTKGDGFAWLPKEKIIFTGDACVNGPFNYMGDASTAGWISVLNDVEKLPFETLCPGHGPLGGRATLVEQRAFFVDLRESVGAMIKEGKSYAEIEKKVDLPRYEKWAGKKPSPSQIMRVHEELSAKSQ